VNRWEGAHNRPDFRCILTLPTRFDGGTRAESTEFFELFFGGKDESLKQNQSKLRGRGTKWTHSGGYHCVLL
jgi:hypothetical protein